MSDKVDRQKTGFTLIELSIVLVIIGLIVGGILVGRDMIRSAEMRSLLTDVERFRTAVNTFRGKYNCLPGDCANATDFLGTDSAGCSPGGGATGTCNGNGNGLIEWPNEAFRSWQQLGQADLVAGHYPGVDADSISKPGINVPASRIAGVGYTMAYVNYVGNLNPAWIVPGSGDFMNRLTAQTQITSPALSGSGPFLTVAEAALLDQKIDDGKPASGTMTANPGGSCAYIAATALDATTRYNLDSPDSKWCNALFTLNQ